MSPRSLSGTGRVVTGRHEIRDFLANATAGARPRKRQRALAPLTPLAVASAGLVDGINPCAFAVLALLLGTLTVAGTRRRVLTVGAAYTLGVFICYLAAGFGITAIVGAAGVAPIFRLVAGAVALIVGLAVLAAAVLERRRRAPAITARGRERIGRMDRGGPGRRARSPRSPSASASGSSSCPARAASTSACSVCSRAAPSPTPCRSSSCTTSSSSCPLVLIVGGVALGLAPSSVDRWRESRRRLVLGVSGAVMVALGLVLLAAELA